MFLEDEQKKLLAKFVEAHRSAPPEYRGDFFVSETMGDPQASFIHSRVQRLGFKGSRADAEVLASVGLLRMSWGSRGTPKFYVLPEGIAAYEQMIADVSPVESVERDIMAYLSDADFKKNHAAAYSKWEQAALLLRSADSGAQLTTIGHLCREAQQAFAESLSAQHRVDISTIEPAKTVARLKAVLRAGSATLGVTEAAFLEALVAYWALWPTSCSARNTERSERAAPLGGRTAGGLCFKPASSCMRSTGHYDDRCPTRTCSRPRPERP
jgi:hypothetical protein